MNNIEKRISAALANGAEYLAMGEIAANTGLLVSQAPRNNANFDIIVNSHDLKKGCRVEVKHSRSGFKANIKGGEFDVLVFIYHPCKIEGGDIKYEINSKREIYVFPNEIVQRNIRGKTGTNFNPKNIIGGFEEYRNAYFIIKQLCT
ncbi:MAG: hypothetical protein GY751_09910 [Bacteroidetes bacterium]|nr:hypothetical protein [Bacteroidota bacterium]